MAERDPGWVSGGVVDAEDARLATGVLVGTGNGPLHCRGGLKPAPDEPGLVEATPTPSGSVTVRPFQGVIQGTRTATTGAYLVTLDQQKTVAVPPGHPTHPRLDLIVARQRDRQYGDPVTAFTVECVSGVASATPTEPEPEGDHLTLALVRVRAGASVITQADLVDRRSFTTALGGVLPLRAGEPLPERGFPGQRLYDLETGQDLVWMPGGWRPAMAGAVTVYGPADLGWPKVETTVEQEPLVFNRLTVPSAHFPRLLNYTATVLAYTTNPTDRYDLHVRVNGVRQAVTAFHGGPTHMVTAIASGQAIQQADTRPVVLEAVFWRAEGTGSVRVGLAGPEYTSINVLAIPL